MVRNRVPYHRLYVGRSLVGWVSPASSDGVRWRANVEFPGKLYREVLPTELEARVKCMEYVTAWFENALKELKD